MSQGSLWRPALLGAVLLAAASANAALLVDNGETGRPYVIVDDDSQLTAHSPGLFPRVPY